MCPSAETKVYSGNNIENAFASDGGKYTQLANAFVYRDKMVAGCTCNGKSDTGIQTISYQDDPTLRPGDIVMTENGPVVFRGAVGPTHKLSDFVPLKESNRVSSSVREKVIAMKLMPARQASVRKIEPKTAAEAAAILVNGKPQSSDRLLGYAAD
jgi:uncharacterized protein DUF2865